MRKGSQECRHILLREAAVEKLQRVQIPRRLTLQKLGEDGSRSSDAARGNAQKAKSARIGWKGLQIALDRHRGNGIVGKGDPLCFFEVGEPFHECDEDLHIGITQRIESEADLFKFSFTSRLLTQFAPFDRVQIADRIGAEIEHANARTVLVGHRLTNLKEGLSIEQVSVEHQMLQRQRLAAVEPLEEASDVCSGQIEILQKEGSQPVAGTVEQAVEEYRQHFRDLRIAADVDALEILRKLAPEIRCERTQRVDVHGRVGHLDSRHQRTDAVSKHVEEIVGGAAAMFVVGEEELLEIGTDELLEGVCEETDAGVSECVGGEVEQLQIDEQSAFHHTTERLQSFVGDLRVVEGKLADGKRVHAALVHRPERMDQIIESLRLERTVAEDETL